MIIIKIKVKEVDGELSVEMNGTPEEKMTLSENMFALAIGPKLNEVIDQCLKQIPSLGDVKHEIPFTMIVKKPDGQN